MAQMLYLRDVSTLSLDRSRCVGCGACVEVCPHPVLAMSDKRSSIVNLDACMECGACAINCVTSAITVDAGVGCAWAVFNSLLGRNGAGCVADLSPGGDSTGGPSPSACC